MTTAHPSVDKTGVHASLTLVSVLNLNRRNRLWNSAFTNYCALEPRNLLAQIIVTTGLDNPVLEPDGEIGLREAIIAANTDQPYLDAPAGNGIDRIVFDPSLENERISLIRGEVAIESGLTIEGSVKIDAARRGRHFRINTLQNVNLNFLELVNGKEDVGGSLYIENSIVKLNASSLYNNESSAGPGGAIYLNGGRLVVSSSNIGDNEAISSDDGSAVGNGGAIQLVSGSVLVNDSVFGNNEAENNGGAINAANGFVLVNNSIFDGTSTSARVGGAISLNRTAEARITNSEFRDTTVSHVGGAIANLGGKVAITNSDFSENVARPINEPNLRTKGGAVYSTGELVLGAEIYINGSLPDSAPNRFHGNQAHFGGAIFQSNSMLFASKESTFSDNKAVVGGAIRLFETNAHIADAKFTANIAVEAGGAIHVLASDVQIMNPKFAKNDAGRLPRFERAANAVGGAIAAEDSSLVFHAETYDTYFDANIASGTGGAIFLKDSDLGVSASLGVQLRFNNNEINRLSLTGMPTVEPRGGAIDAIGSQLLLDRSLFTANQTNQSDSSVDRGGAIALNQSNAQIRDSFFATNSANFGGAISVANESHLRTKSATFRGNVADHNGGAIVIDTASSADLIRSSFGGERESGSDSTANRVGGSGGAVANHGKLFVNSSLFTFNEAKGNRQQNEPKGVGGAIFNAGEFKVTGTSFSENLAGDGGAIFSLGSMTASNSIFRSNRSLMLNSDRSLLEGGAVYSEGNTKLHNVVFVANQSESGGALAISGGELRAHNVTFGGENEADANVARTREGQSNSGSGGAVWITGDARAIFGRGTFEGNIARQQGGAIAIDGAAGRASALLFNSSILSNNMAGPVPDSSESLTFRGGAVFVADGRLDIRNSAIENNKAAMSGGAIYLGDHADAVVRSTEIKANSAEAIGGGILNSGEFLIVDSLVSGNTAREFGNIADIAPSVSRLVRTEVVDAA